MDAIALCEYATDLAYQGRAEEMVAAFDQSLSLNNDRATHFHKAINLLRVGMWEAGWKEWHTQFFAPDNRLPWWDGGHVNHLVVYHQGGWGDRLQFMRYMPLVRQRCERLTLTSTDAPAQGDCYTAPMSLPWLLRVFDPADSPRPPYVNIGAETIEGWRQRLAKISGYRVGICWQGNPTRSSEPNRSIPLSEFLPLRDIPGVRLLSLQKGYGIEQLQGVERIVNLDPHLDEGGRPKFGDSAAVIQNLDLVITSDTAIAHLAGGLGKPVWLAICARPDWRWGLTGEATAWYPSMRLFRQKRLGDWSEVFSRIETELRSIVHGAA